MCGRFALALPAKSLAEHFQLETFPEFSPRYNIAPAQLVATIVKNKKSNKRVMKIYRWGLIPPWSKDPAIGSRLINARSETVAEKPSFRSAFRNKRCLIPATGFYEWKRQDKQPYFIRMLDEKPFAFAGLWEHWKGKNETIESCTILTVESNMAVRSIHDRMPVILPSDSYDIWLDPGNTKIESLEPLLKPYPPADMIIYPVGTYVNKPKNDDPECIQSL
ncbi:SOS response-associated peptidase [Candidatus Latescibacterota bacterium]